MRPPSRPDRSDAVGGCSSRLVLHEFLALALALGGADALSSERGRRGTPETIFVMKLQRASAPDREDCSFGESDEVVARFESAFPYAPNDDHLGAVERVRTGNEVERCIDVVLAVDPADDK